MERSASGVAAQGSASLGTTNHFVLEQLRTSGKLEGAVLDLGAGSGFFTRLLSAERAKQGIKAGDGIAACDISGSTFKADNVTLKECDVNLGLRYEDAAFDAVVAIEVFEHTRAPYDVIAEVYRVLKPGGLLIFSVPNVGHALSRIKFLFSGHYHMFPSPSIKPENAGRICGHIAPLPFQYWHYGLRRAGFADISLAPDRAKRSASFFAGLLWPANRLGTAAHTGRIARREPALAAETDAVAREANSWTALTSRSLVFSARKP
jgi:SAM-dependent methyltransferase